MEEPRVKPSVHAQAFYSIAPTVYIAERYSLIFLAIFIHTPYPSINYLQVSHLVFRSHHTCSQALPSLSGFLFS